jgi:hypothetical protein
VVSLSESKRRTGPAAKASLRSQCKPRMNPAHALYGLAPDMGYEPHPTHTRELAERMDQLAVDDPEGFDDAWEELRKLGRLG